MNRGSMIQRLLHPHASRQSLHSSTRCARRLISFLTHSPSETKILPFKNLNHHFPYSLLGFSRKRPISTAYNYSYSAPRFFNISSTYSNQENGGRQVNLLQDETSEEEEVGGEIDGWEEEEVVESKIGDGGDGGGVALLGVPWGEQALSIARAVLLQFGNDLELYAFKTSPRGYVYVRLDKLSNQYGCPSMEELENYSEEYKKKLDEVGARGEIPDDLALEVSSPGAERILKVPDDLSRFREMPMRVCYIEGHGPEKEGVFFLESIETEAENCIWKLADVKENRDPESKGRPLSRKRRDWRLKLPFQEHKCVTLYLEF